jgi:hypothetical protein
MILILEQIHFIDRRQIPGEKACVILRAISVPRWLANLLPDDQELGGWRNKPFSNLMLAIALSNSDWRAICFGYPGGIES